LEVEPLRAPQIVHAEVANALRTRLLRGDLALRDADGAHGELLRLEFALYGYVEVASRVWQLRDNVTPYDAWYVALAEYLEEPLATLDGNLIRAPGPRCEFVTFRP
jgi:predicted nucleic acid-binding protein